MAEMRMVEAQVNEMIDLLRLSANKLRETQQSVSNLAKNFGVEDGALEGMAGDDFNRALEGTLNPAIERMAKKLEERANYVEKERDEWKRAMSESGALYTGS